MTRYFILYNQLIYKFQDGCHSLFRRTFEKEWAYSAFHNIEEFLGNYDFGQAKEITKEEAEPS